VKPIPRVIVIKVAVKDKKYFKSLALETVLTIERIGERCFIHNAPRLTVRSIVTFTKQQCNTTNQGERNGRTSTVFRSAA
jgi:hypothetical protein